MAFGLSRASRAKLQGVHPDLVAVVERAIELTDVDFRVTQGVRTLAEQKRLLAAKATKTLRSRHIPETSKRAPHVAHAVDVVALVDGKVSWHGPLYNRIAAAFQKAARQLGVPVEWGGECFGPKFFDGPHFQLPWKGYP